MHTTPPDNKDPNAPWYHMPANGLGEPSSSTPRPADGSLCVTGAESDLLGALVLICLGDGDRCSPPGTRGAAKCGGSSEDYCFCHINPGRLGGVSVRRCRSMRGDVPAAVP